MISTVDQLNRNLSLNDIPKKIVSVVPSQTELLFDLGLSKEVKGITKFCIHPHEWFTTKTRVGGTKNLDLQKIIEINPDLILCNKEENTEKQINELSEKFPVWISDISTLTDALNMIAEISKITGRQESDKNIVEQIQSSFSELFQKTKIPVAYILWKNPYMTAGGDTFISCMLEYAGYSNVFQNSKRYPEITIDDVKNSKAEFVFLSSEPYPFKEKHANELSEELSGKKVLCVDGEMFSWYGSRLLKAPSYFSKLRVKVDSPL